MKKEILVIDCEERGNFWLTLKSDYRILFAATGEEGLEMLSEDTGLVFLSLVLSDMNSMVVLGHITRKYPSARVIVSAPCGTEEPCMCLKAFRRGAWDYIRKPLNANEVFRKIGAALTSVNASPKGGETASLMEEMRGEYPDVPSHLVNGVVKVRDFVARNYSESLSLTTACKMAGTSRTYFCRFFKRLTGHSLRSYHHAVKIQVAERLLRDEGLSVTDVAIRLGYNDSNYFSTIYKKLTGISPRYSRASGRGEGSAEKWTAGCRQTCTAAEGGRGYNTYAKGGHNGETTKDIGS